MVRTEALRLSFIDYKSLAVATKVEGRLLGREDIVDTAGKWAMREHYPARVHGLSEGREAIAGPRNFRPDAVIAPFAWRFARSVGAFAVASETAARITEVAEREGYEMCGFAIGTDSEATLHIATASGRLDDSLYKPVLQANVELYQQGVPLHLVVNEGRVAA